MEKKKVKLFSTIALLALALLVVGATYAYFQNQYGSASNADVKVTTYTTDMLTFETGSNISITAGQDDFASGKGNKQGKHLLEQHFKQIIKQILQLQIITCI